MEKSSDENSEKFLNIQRKKKLENFDDILPYVGDFGKYQWILLSTLLIFGIGFTTIFFSQIFITIVPQNYWCKVNEIMELNLTQEQRKKLVIPESKQFPYYDRCNYKKLNLQNISMISEENIDSLKLKTDEIVRCEQWEYNYSDIPYASISVELNWVCDQEYLIAFAQSVFYIGSIFGNFIFGWISDQKGRTMGLLCCTATAFLACIGTANAHSFWTYAFFRFLIGFAYDNIIIIPLIIALEYATPRKRAFIGSYALGFNFALGTILVPWTSYFIRNWRLFAYVYSIPCLLCFVITLFMPESIRWYMSKGKYDKIVQKLRKISAVNGKYPEPWVYDEFLRNISDNTKNVETVTVLDLRRTPYLAGNIVLLALIFSFSTLVGDTHIYYSSRYDMSIFMSFSLFSLEVLVAAVIAFLIGNRWGIRFSGSLGLLLCSVFSLTFVLTKQETVKSVVGCIGRMSISFVQILYSQYVPEFFPTSFRAQGAAVIHFLSVLLHFCAPYLMVLASSWRELPMLVISILAALASGLILFLPETSGENLRQTLQDAEDFCKKKKFWPIFIVRKINHS